MLISTSSIQHLIPKTKQRAEINSVNLGKDFLGVCSYSEPLADIPREAVQPTLIETAEADEPSYLISDTRLNGIHEINDLFTDRSVEARSTRASSEVRLATAIERSVSV